MQWVDVMQLAKRGESAKVKFLSEIESHDDLFPYLVGMANNNGGKIIIGIDVKNYHLRGTFIDKEWLDQRVNDHCYPFVPFDVDVVNRGDKRIVCVTILQSNHKPFYFDKKCFVMEHAYARLVLEEEKSRFHPQQDPGSARLTMIQNDVNSDVSIQTEAQRALDSEPETKNHVSSIQTSSIQTSPNQTSLNDTVQKDDVLDSENQLSRDQTKPLHDSVGTPDVNNPSNQAGKTIEHADSVTVNPISTQTQENGMLTSQDGTYHETNPVSDSMSNAISNSMSNSISQQNSKTLSSSVKVDHVSGKSGLDSTYNSLGSESHIEAENTFTSQPQLTVLQDDEKELSSRQKKVLRFLTQHDSIKNKEYRELYNVSHKTAHLELVELLDKGLLIQQGGGRSTCYLLADRSKFIG